MKTRHPSHTQTTKRPFSSSKKSSNFSAKSQAFSESDKPRKLSVSRAASESDRPKRLSVSWAASESDRPKRLSVSRAVSESDRPRKFSVQSPAIAIQYESERVQKFLAARGIGSRREIEEWIRQGRIFIDGKRAELGDKVSEKNFIALDHQELKLFSKKKKLKVLLYHKPAGEVCTRNDPEGRPTVFEKLPRLRHERWVMVGRLDLNTEGLLIFTNDGEVAHRLMHPRFEMEREYAVRVFGEVTEEMLVRLKNGIKLEDDHVHKFEDIQDAGGEGKNHWYHVILKEGRYREVRRLWESQGVVVSRLIRVRFGDIELPRFLKLGMIRAMEEEDVSLLLKKLELPV